VSAGGGFFVCTVGFLLAALGPNCIRAHPLFREGIVADVLFVTGGWCCAFHELVVVH
jgi:hypothetical protein